MQFKKKFPCQRYIQLWIFYRGGVFSQRNPQSERMFSKMVHTIQKIIIVSQSQWDNTHESWAMIDFVSYRSTDRLTGDQLKKAEYWENTP